MGQPLSTEALDTIFNSARTYNGYLDKPVSEDQLHQIWELTKMGPTSANMLPARFVWCVSQESKDKLAALSSGANGPKIQAAPVTVIIGSDINFNDHIPDLFPHAPEAKDWFGDAAARELPALRNSSLQGGYFIIAARALGLDTGPMSGFDNAAVDEAFFAGTAIKSNFICTLGYGDPSTIFGRLPRPGFDRFNSVV
ncbi:malonic semialdehyde reductase [Sphingobium boeckii]|uniref:3-hydroxypropanoate dehydrogenase n=1 Tax=Sphingobium boeckii TaxID=1082345 RepID=A0A7W9AIS4_9SPHN|nr:malonic semialdehyde reductase [Sphingobium boeckii]MBB5686221.1 3-hydroxypropanoate dehydrogenase [Sphingobium boeckii]